MSLLKKLVVVSAVLVVFLMTVIWYIGHYRRDDYSNRYEDGFTAMFYSIVASVIVLGATVVMHFVGERLRLMRLLKKLLLVSAVLGGVLMTVDWYTSPHDYEDWLEGLFYAIALSVIVLVATAIIHLTGLRGSRPEA